MNSSQDQRSYALLYISTGRTTHVNLKAGHDPVDIYLSCAATCSSSFRSHGKQLIVLTNAREQLLERCKRLEIVERVELQSHNFSLNVPQGIPFYEAHFKLDLFEAFGSGGYGPSATLLDIDTILLRSLREPAGLGLVNLTAEAVGAMSADTVRRDISRLSGMNVAEPFWFGGEFVSGSADLFRLLSQKIKQIWPRYLGELGNYHHTGDEMLLNAALPLVLADGVRVDDFVASGDIARWWSIRTASPQPAFGRIADAALLHLPGDKPFLAGWRKIDRCVQRDDFLRKYRSYVQRRIAVRRLVSVAEAILGRRSRRFIPSLD